MPVFQVVSRTVQMAALPKRKPRRLRQEWSAIIRFIVAVVSSGGFFTLLLMLFKGGASDAPFILLPVILSLAVGQFQRHNIKTPLFVFNMFLSGTPIYLLLTICLTFIYYSI